jgi:steroid 5-alpha reductase family enzyme
VLTTLWGVRLGGYLYWRNHGKGEDFRYQAMRKHYGSMFALKSLFIVFGLQGVLMWIVSLPVQLGQMTNNAKIGIVGFVGIAVWVVGFLFESVGDIQLARFKANSANSGKVMDKGLWKFTRHPNYFGDACAWWGIALIAAESRIGLFGIFGAIVMNILLLKYSGVPILEKSINKRRPGYEEYQRRTSSFVPRLPKK